MKKGSKIFLICIAVLLLLSGCFFGKKDKTEDDTAQQQAQQDNFMFAIAKPGANEKVRNVLTVETKAVPVPDSVEFLFDNMNKLRKEPPFNETFDIKSYEPGQFEVQATAYWDARKMTRKVAIQIEKSTCDTSQAVIIGGYPLPSSHVRRSEDGCPIALTIETEGEPAKDFLDGLSIYSETVEELTIRGETFSQIDLGPVSSLTGLKRLTLSLPGLLTLDMTPITNLPLLESLEINSTALTVVNLTPMAKVGNLKELRIRDNTILSEINLLPIGEFKGLTVLDISGNAIEETNLDPLKSQLSLKYLDLSKNLIKELTVKPLTGLPELAWLDLSNNRIEFMDPSPLGLCQKLEYFDVSHNRLTSLDMQRMRSCLMLSEINLGFNELASVKLPAAPNIRRIDLYSNMLTGIELSPLAASPDLEWLILDRNDLVTLDLRGITSGENFKGLWASFNQIADIDLSPLAACPRMEQLDLFHNGIGYIDLEPLRSASALWRIDLSANNIIDIDLTPIFGIPALDELYLYDNPFNDNSCAGIHRYISDHPRVHVEHGCNDDNSDTPAMESLPEGEPGSGSNVYGAVPGTPMVPVSNRPEDFGEEIYQHRTITRPETIEQPQPGEKDETSRRQAQAGQRL